MEIADVVDKDGNSLFPYARQVFFIQNQGDRAKVMVLDNDGNLEPKLVKKSAVVSMGTMSVDEYRAERQKALNASETASGASKIEVNRGEEEKNVPEKPLTETEANELVGQMEAGAEEAPELELTPENWEKEFGEDGTVDTPIGKVKMGENQISKLFLKGRDGQFGMIRPTLFAPDIIIEETSEAKTGEAERQSSYIFIKCFIRNGKKVKYYASITVSEMEWRCRSAVII